MTYFTAKNLDRDIYHIYDPQGAYVTLFVGEHRALLFDTGYGLGDLKAFIRTITGRPLIVVNSHAHFDHILGNDQFDEVFISKEDLRLAPIYQTKEIKTCIYRKASWNGSLPEGFILESYLKAGEKNNLMELSEQYFDLGGLTLMVVGLAGHTAGSIGLYVKERGWLFAGDGANHRMLLYLPGAVPVRQYLDTLCRIQNLGASKFITGHNEELYDIENIERFKECILHYNEAKAEIFTIPEMPSFQGKCFGFGHMKEGDEIAAVLPCDSNG